MASVLLLLACLLGSLCDDDPDLREAYRLSQSAQSESDYTRVIEICRVVLEQSVKADDARFAKKLMSWAHNRRGEAFLTLAELRADKRGEMEQLALDDFEAATQVDPKNWRAWHNRGVSLGADQDYEQAIKDFDRVVTLNPQHADAWFNRAEMKLALKRHEPAARDYSAAIKLQPDDVVIYRRRALAYRRLERWYRVEADLTKAIELAPEHVKSRVDRGDVYVQLNQWKKAADDYRRSIEIDGQSIMALSRAAWLMATCPVEDFRNEALALEAARQAVQLEKEPHFRRLDVLAAALANAGLFDEAKQTVGKAVEQAPVSERPVLEARKRLYESREPYRVKLR